ncbi:MAG TPA: hypothetical protein VMH86_15535 [Rhizomicrobium sp.]|nr:hypothetical protein [Rhizomicrobium sp.]
MPPSIATARSRISLKSGAGEAQSPAGWIVAILLHAALIAAAFLSFAHRLDIVDQSTPVVPVDLVTLGAKTNVIPQQKQQKAPPREQDVAPQPQQIQLPTPAPAQAAEPAPPDLNKAPAKAPPAPSPAARPQAPQPDKAKVEDQGFSALLNKLTAPPAAQKNVKVGSRTIAGIGQMNQMTADLQSLLQSEIRECWSPPVGAPHPERLIVNFELFLNKDGSVAQPPQLAADSQAAAAGDPYMRAAVDAARRAIYTCAPYKLPADRFEQWRDITFTFNPAQMAGAQ